MKTASKIHFLYGQRTGEVLYSTEQDCGFYGYKEGPKREAQAGLSGVECGGNPVCPLCLPVGQNSVSLTGQSHGMPRLAPELNTWR